MTDEKKSELCNQVQECFKELGLPLMEKRNVHESGFHPDRLVFHSWTKNGVNLYEISAIIAKHPELVLLSISNREKIPEEKWPSLWRLSNILNNMHPSGRWVMDRLSENMEYRNAVLVTESGFNQEQFRTILKRSLEVNNRYHPMIRKMLENGKDPLDLLRDFEIEVPKVFEER